MELIFVVYLIFIVAPISLFIHEVGHVIGALLVKSESIKLVIGTGNKRTLIRCTNVVTISIHQWFFRGAYTESKRNIPLQPMETAIVVVLGPIVSLLFSSVFYYFNQIFMHPLLYLFVLFNLWIGIVNLIPFKIGNKQSDGFIIWRTFVK
ncbi:hypothetical protein ACLIBH_02590 [Virgibacillus sp. W0430]|uniref:hypothetical protein n=1 Tax=Virgibacillus sp. W0430 TaxID=3391580 RepID=UPI003F4639DE